MNKRKETIVAVVLTHNRKALLQIGLEGVFRQTHLPDKIVIIDSLSTDGTFEALSESGAIVRPDVEYLRLEENKGPSGGFAQGIEHALKDGPDWIWVLDDDIVPKEDCLEQLLQYKKISKCIAPRREGKTVPFFNPAIGIVTHRRNLSFDTGKECVFTNTCCFEGMLISADLIKKIGVPDERFFQVYGDTIYGFVASLHTNVVHVKKAVMNRLLPTRKPITSRRVYLLIRNHFLVKEYLKKNKVVHPMLFTFNFLLMVIHYGVILPFKTLSITMPFAVFMGVFHGFMGKFGTPKLWH
jgi:rhamnopyranosyl-N-acetylglucosaminyl-diphospho-decaprenol beta-1,3/1,4-galactofuranosyltransferase